MAIPLTPSPVSDPVVEGLAPLFIPSLAALKSALGLTAVTSADRLACIDRAVRKARVGFYDRLGASRVGDILLIAYADSPATEQGMLRLKASETEISWVRMELLREMPVLLMPAAAASQQIWNEDSLTRNADNSLLDREISRLRTEIDDALQDLVAGQAEVEGSTLNVCVPAPTLTPARPWDSVRNPWLRNQ